MSLCLLRARCFASALCAIYFFGILNSTVAKRLAPEYVTPIIADNVEYSAPHELMGFVIARDLTTGKELWRQRIYQITRDLSLERDVQDVFIKTLTINKNGTLTVINERGAVYVLNLSTRKVTKQK